MTIIEETWTTTAVPILEEVLRGEQGDADASTASLIHTGDPLVHRTLAALIEDGYLGGAGVQWAIGRAEPIITMDILRLTPKGRRAVGQWPDGQPGDVLIRALEAALLTLPEGETKTRVRTLLGAARDVGTDVLSGVISNALKSTLGLP